MMYFNRYKCFSGLLVFFLLQLTLTIQNLPSPAESTYYCAFSGHGVVRQTDAKRIPLNEPALGNHTIECDTPEFNLLPVFPTSMGRYPNREGANKGILLLKYRQSIPTLHSHPGFPICCHEHNIIVLKSRPLLF